MPARISTVARNAGADGIVDLIDVGGTGEIRIFTGTQPANPQTALTGTLLSEHPFSATAFGAASAGVATANAITSDTVLATGTAGWARVYDGGGVDPGDAVIDMDIGQGSGTLDFDNTSFVVGGTAAISAMTVTAPES